MLDEFPALGRLDFFESALAFMAGYGIKSFLIAQSLNQIEKAYGQNHSILDNCHVRVSFATNDERTAKRVSDALGTATELRAMRNYAGHRLSPWLGHLMVSRQETARALLTPGEVMQLPPDDELVLVSGCPPIRAKKARYYEDRQLQARVLPPPKPRAPEWPKRSMRQPIRLGRCHRRRACRMPVIRPIPASAASPNFPNTRRLRPGRARRCTSSSPSTSNLTTMRSALGQCSAKSARSPARRPSIPPTTWALSPVRSKHTFRLPPDIASKLADYAARKRVPQALVVETALASHLSPDGADRLEAALARRLDRMTRQIERLEHHVKISNEAIALFVRFWLTSMPPLPDSAQTAAQIKGRERYEGFIEALGRRLAQRPLPRRRDCRRDGRGR